MLLSELVAASADVAATSSRTAKTQRLADVVSQLGDDELAAGLALLAGHPRQDRLELGWAASYRATADPVVEPQLTLADVDAAFESLSLLEGHGSGAARRQALESLLRRATAPEQDFLRGIVRRELRQGAGSGLLLQGVAMATNVEHDAVRRAAALTGDLSGVVQAARSGGSPAVDALGMQVGVAFDPMLAQSASDLRQAIEQAGDTILEAKLDGIRLQLHIDGREVRLFTRNRNEVTHRIPELVALSAGLGLRSAVLDAEALILDAQSRPVMFQESMQRFGTEGGTGTADVPLTVRFFDVLLLDGAPLLDEPLEARLAALDAAVSGDLIVDRVRTAHPDTARDFLRKTLEAGHEGVVLKDPSAPYEPGVRSSAWRKHKPAHTLDLVILAAEWGSGRRKGWLSNLHLGALDPKGAGPVMLGKTFKGLTDAMLTWQTERLLELETGRSGHVVHVRPELVVEVAFDGVQSSSRYPAGMALRFARVKAHRPDKRADQADTVETVRAIFEGRRSRPVA